jgi:CRP/FNR family transcriptional regulator, nitrogen oxide reductase regulator
LATDSIRLGKSFGQDTPIAGIEMLERANVLRESKLYANLSVSECIQIAAHARTRCVARNDLLFMQGQSFRQLVLIQSGCVKLTRLSQNGSEVIVELRGARDAVDIPSGPFGQHSCTARAISKCKVLTWEWPFLEKLMSIPQISRNICFILSEQLNELQQRYHEVSAEKVSRRLACTLLRISKHFGVPSDGGIEISISRHELAQMTGTTLFTVSRLVSKWGELGLVLPRREAVLILDPKGLDHVSQMED